jgi:glyoxylase-like metal-dependent hydrolase (beta-lactamase superfamily II)
MSITPEELYKKISQKNNLLLLDVRNPEDFNASRVEGRFTPETINIPYYEFIEDEQKTLKRIPKDREIVALCNKGNSSDFVVEILKKQQIQACNIEGGITAWGNLYVTHAIPSENYEIIQIDRPARGCLSYLLISNGEALVIDPSRHISFYKQLIASKKAKLKAVFDTHAHADHISGGAALAEAEKVPYFLHPYDAIHPFDMLPAKLSHYEMLNEGFSFKIGELTLKVLHVPGHTLGEVCFLVRDYLFSGDSLFLQSFGRPDLGGQGKAWAPLVYNSLFETIRKEIPGTTLVLPSHYASAQEANESGVFAQKLDDLFKSNRDLQVSKEAFIQYVLDHLPTLPPQYQQIKRVNLGLASPTEEEAAELELGKNICALSTAYNKNKFP